MLGTLVHTSQSAQMQSSKTSPGLQTRRTSSSTLASSCLTPMVATHGISAPPARVRDGLPMVAGLPFRRALATTAACGASSSCGQMGQMLGKSRITTM
jgi:hypothetical protein